MNGHIAQITIFFLQPAFFFNLNPLNQNTTTLYNLAPIVATPGVPRVEPATPAKISYWTVETGFLK